MLVILSVYGFLLSFGVFICEGTFFFVFICVYYVWGYVLLDMESILQRVVEGLLVVECLVGGWTKDKGEDSLMCYGFFQSFG